MIAYLASIFVLCRAGFPSLLALSNKYTYDLLIDLLTGNCLILAEEPKNC